MNRFGLVLLIAGVQFSTDALGQSGTVLKGSAQVDVNTDPPHIMLLVQDMSHNLGIIRDSERRDANAQTGFNNDIAEFNNLTAAQSGLAKEYSPCVAQYQAAFPHYWQAATLFENHGQAAAINTQLKRGSALQQAGDKCANNVDWNKYMLGAQQFSGNGSSSPGAPGLPPWNPTGGIPTMGGPSNTPGNPISGRVGSSPCLPFGPGGYDYCANPTQPAGCVCRKLTAKNNRPPARNNPIGDTGAYLKGLAEGLGDCLKGVYDLVGAAALILSGNFTAAAQQLGLQPGQEAVLKGIYQELTTRNIGISPEEAGRIAGRRLCAYGLIPGVYKAAKLPGSLRAAGSSAQNPLQGGFIWNTPVEQLPGKFIQTPWGPVKLGGLAGKGASGTVYRLPSTPGKVIKIGNHLPDTPASFTRQLAGYNTVTKLPTPITTPKIYGSSISPVGQPSFLILDDIFGGKWPGANIVPDLGNLAPAQLKAMQNLYNQLAKNGFVWSDGHSSNVFFYNGPNGLQAAMVETDGVIPASNWQQFQALPEAQKAISLLQKGGIAFQGDFSAQSVMNGLFRIRFGNF